MVYLGLHAEEQRRYDRDLEMETSEYSNKKIARTFELELSLHSPQES